MEKWISTANELIMHITDINSKNYNDITLIRQQATNMLPFSGGYENNLIKMIEDINDLLVFNKRDVENTITSCEPRINSSEIVIVLGCKDKNEQSKRVNNAIYYVTNSSQNVKAVLFSGGGYNINKSEAQLMNEEFASKCKLNIPIYCEEDSMDTVGNALFSRHTIDSNLLHSLNKQYIIKVFTSTFHVKRTYEIFAHVFDPSSLTVIGSNDYGFNDSLIESELKSTILSDNSIFTIKCGENANKLTHNDWKMSMIQLFLNHDLYKKRYDLMRKYC